ncbi:hypothetical protein JCM6882_001713 [Rhodosporidiobolus microsporus]
MDPHDPLAALHTHSLSFSLDDLEALSSAQLALVQFHPEASELQQERAKLVFVQRRRGWLEEQKKVGPVKREEEAVEVNVKMEGAVKREEKEEEDVKPVKLEREERAAPPVRVKQEVEEISLLDEDDDDEPVIIKGGKADKGKGKATAPPLPKKRKSDPAEASSSSFRAAKAPRRVPPPPPPPLPPAETASPPAALADSGNKLLKLPSFRRTTSNPRPPPQPEPEEEPLPFSLPGLKPPPRPAPSAPAAPTVPPPSINLDALFRTTLPRSPPRTASPPPLPLPEFRPNHATLAHDRAHAWLPDWVVESFSSDEQAKDPHFVYRPPPVDPEWHDLPPESKEDAEGLAPEELRKQLVTVKVSGLDETLTAELLFRFLVRGKRLHPRPLAIRRLDEVEDGWSSVDGRMEVPAKPFLVAFRSLEDAQRAISYSSNKQLPNVPEGWSNYLTLSFAAPWPPPPPKPTPPSAATSSTSSIAHIPPEPQLTPLERHLQLIKAADAELAIEWKWGELSEEVRRTWRERERLPTSKRCPPRDISAGDSDWVISDEYEEELERILNPTDALVLFKAKQRVEIAKEKKAIYLERCKVWNVWSDKADPKNVDPHDPSKPEIPTYPFDDVAKERIEARKAVERQKRQEELDASIAALAAAVKRGAAEDEARWEATRQRMEEETARTKAFIKELGQSLKKGETQPPAEEEQAQPAEGHGQEGAGVCELSAAEERQRRREKLAKVALASFGFKAKPGVPKYGTVPSKTTSSASDGSAVAASTTSTPGAGPSNAAASLARPAPTTPPSSSTPTGALKTPRKGGGLSLLRN